MSDRLSRIATLVSSLYNCKPSHDRQYLPHHELSIARVKSPRQLEFLRRTLRIDELHEGRYRNMHELKLLFQNAINLFADLLVNPHPIHGEFFELHAGT